MELNQKSIRGILAQILSVDEKYIIPKQGNFFNPQELESNPSTWCAYRIQSNKSVTSPYYQEVDGVNTALCQKIAVIELQFVGTMSEEIAQSVSFWSMREDVKKAFASVQGSLMYTPVEAISSIFSQDGNNTILAWNTTIQILWISEIKTGQNLIKTIDIGGHINVG